MVEITKEKTPDPRERARLAIEQLVADGLNVTTRAVKERGAVSSDIAGEAVRLYKDGTTASVGEKLAAALAEAEQLRQELAETRTTVQALTDRNGDLVKERDEAQHRAMYLAGRVDGMSEALSSVRDQLQALTDRAAAEDQAREAVVEQPFRARVAIAAGPEPEPEAVAVAVVEDGEPEPVVELRAYRRERDDLATFYDSVIAPWVEAQMRA